MKTSNKLTLVRICAAPLLFILYNLPSWLSLSNGSKEATILSFILIPLLAVVEITDYFDGSYARSHGEVSDFGKMFDPFADVFLHLSMFTCFVFSGYMPIVFYILILYREFSQNFLRMVVAKQGTAIAARKGGKVKTVFYVASCFFTLVQVVLDRSGLSVQLGINMEVLLLIGQVMFGVSVFLSYFSFFDYLRNFGSVLKNYI